MKMTLLYARNENDVVKFFLNIVNQNETNNMTDKVREIIEKEL